MTDSRPIWLSFLALSESFWGMVWYKNHHPRVEWATGDLDSLKETLIKKFPMHVQQYLVIDDRTHTRRYEKLGFKVKVNRSCFPILHARAFAEMRETGLLYLPKFVDTTRFKAGGKEIARWCDGPLCRSVQPSCKFRTPQDMLCHECADFTQAMRQAKSEAQQERIKRERRESRRLR